MKISNNALNFLLAQYRAIFKRAYVKGIASAVLLTAALATGQAQAAVTTQDGTLSISDFASGSGDTCSGTVTNSATIDLSDLAANQIASNKTYLGNHIFDGSGAQITIEGVSGTNIIINDGTSQDLKIQNGASLTVTNTGNANTVIYGGDSGNSGTLTVSGTGSTLTLNAASAWFNKLTIADNATINLQGEYGGASKANYGQWQYFAALVGQNDGSSTSGSGTISASTLNLGDAAFFGANKTVEISGSKITFDGSAVTPVETASGDDLYASAFINAGVGTATEGTITIASGSVNGQNVKSTLTVNDGKWGALYANTIKVSDTDIKIGSGATFIMDGDFAGTGAQDEGTHDQVSLTLDDVTFDNQGTTIIGNPTSGGEVTVQSGTTTLTGNIKNYAQITISGSSSDPATLVISENQLAKPAADATDPSGLFAGKSGSVVLSGGSFDGAVLKLVGTDADGLDLLKDITLTSGDAVQYGEIGVKNSGTIAGEHLVLTGALNGKIGTNKLALEADILEIGTNTTTSKLSTFSGAEQFTAHDDLVLRGSDDTFTIDKAVILSRDFYEKDANGDYITSQPKAPGTITSADLIIGDGSNSGSITINGGAWENEGQALTIQSGTLSVSAVDDDLETMTNSGSDGVGTPWTYYKNGNPASLTWNGDFSISGAATDDASVTVTGASGANAVLDLRNADITWGSGSITLSGALASGEDDPVRVSPNNYFARAGQGILKLDGDQVSEYLGHGLQTVATTLTIDDGGLLLVNGSIINDIDVDDFEVNGTATAGDINISGGKMFVTGSLSLVDGVGTGGKPDATANGLTIDGVLGADTISYTNKSTSIDSKKPETDVATVSGGTLAVTSSFSSKNHEVKFVSGAGLLLDSKGFLQEWAPETAGEGGTVSVDHLTFTGKDSGTTDSKLDVQTGAWIIGSADNLGDVDILEGAELNVGPESAKFIRTGFGASLTLDNLTVTSGASSNSGSVTVQDGSKLTVNTIQIDAGSELTVGDSATVTITGNYAHNLGSDNKLVDGVPEGLTDLGATNVDKQAGINLEGADITLNSGKLVIGDTAARKLVTLDASAAENKQVTISDVLISPLLKAMTQATASMASMVAHA